MQPQSVVKSLYGQASRETDELVKDGGANGLKLVFRPYYSENPYQNLLKEHLAKLGVQMGEDNGRTRFLIMGKVPDILHLHWLHPLFQAQNTTITVLRLLKFISGLVILKLMGVKIVWTAHNLKSHESAYPFLERICTFVIPRLAHAIIAHCEAAKYEIATKVRLRDKDKIFVVPHGNYVDYYKNEIDRLEARKALEIPNSSLVFLFLGLLRPYKGMFELISTFKQLHGEELQLMIAGKTTNDELSEQIRQKIEGHDNIKFMPGFIPDNQIQVYMNACDVVVFPYRDVLTSGAVILAMSFSKTCIAPRMGCIGETLDNSGAFLYDPENEEGLLQAMNSAVENSAALLRMGEYNRQSADQWNWDSIAEKTLNVYRQCLSR